MRGAFVGVHTCSEYVDIRMAAGCNTDMHAFVGVCLVESYAKLKSCMHGARM